MQGVVEIVGRQIFSAYIVNTGNSDTARESETNKVLAVMSSSRSDNVTKGRLQKKTDYFMTLIKRVGGYLAGITTS